MGERAREQVAMLKPSYDLRPVDLRDVRHLFEAHHGYGGCGVLSVACFAVFEDGRPVAAYTWQPPPPGAARAVCPEEPGAVLSLSRMVAVPREKRQLNHVSKPLRRQMRVMLDRTRWPVLVTYHDEGQGHTGHVYRCSGWTATACNSTPVYEVDGVRVSSYSAGVHSTEGKTRNGSSNKQRWEHWACQPGEVAAYMASGGWWRRRVPGRYWHNGAPMHEWTREPRVHQAQLFGGAA
jgi:hypothetical protein